MSDKPDPKETGLISTGNKSLTTRSSSLVRRGLKDLISKQAHVIRFPPDRSMGTLWVSHKDVAWHVDACGPVTVPVETWVHLYLDVSFEDLSPLATLEADDLQELTMECEVDDDGLLHIRGLSGLKRLLLDGCQITDAGLPHLRRLTNLEKLRFWNTLITDAGLVHLRSLTELRYLDLRDNQIAGAGKIADAGLMHLSGLTKLESLSILSAQITDAGLENIRGLTSLKDLSLDAPQVTNVGLAHIRELSLLERLTFKNTQITDDAVSDLRRGLPNCHIENYGYSSDY